MVALFVMLTILACVGIDGIVQWRKGKRELATGLLADRLVPAEALAKLSAPPDVFLDEGHTWVRVTPSGAARIGIDGFAQELIGRIDDVLLPEVGRVVRRGDMLFSVRQDKHRAAFASPVNGVVETIDKELHWHPERIQDNPYKDGWVCSLKPKNLGHDLKLLRIADEAIGWLKQEAMEFKEFFAARPLLDRQLGQVLQDGGQLRGGVLEFADDETWKQFNEIFLRPSQTKVN